MKVWRRIGAVLLAASLFLSGSPTGAGLARAAEDGFPDVSPRDWYEKPVSALARQGIIGGREDGLFHPNDPITRAEFLRLLSALSGREAVADAQLLSKFKDVKPASWYAPYVSWALQEKLIGGMTETTFAPDSPINRQQLALILYRFNKNVMGRRLPQGQSSLFTDSRNLSAWAKKEALALGRAGLISGYQDHSFRPASRATRAEAAQILYNYLRAYKDYALGCATSELRYIMHGGGDIDGKYPNSNSLESVNESLRRGNHVLELDFSWTSDQYLVCAHHLDDPGATREEFLSSRVYGELTPMDLDTLADFMRTHPQVKVIPDIKSRNVEGLRLIREKCSDLLERFLPYVTHLADYETIRQLGFPNLILTTYMMGKREKREVRGNVEFARKNDLIALAIPYEADLTGQYLSMARKEGVPIVLDTVNSAITMESYVLQGADGFFTNSQTLKIPRFQHLGF